MEQVIDQDLRERVVRGMGALLPGVLKREVADVSEGVRLFDLGMSSANTLELLLELEDELEIQIDVEEIGESDLESVGTLADFIARHALTDD
jgi:acyl carrier protein